MSNNYKTIFSFDDENITIMVINGNFNMPVILFQKSISIENGLISNFFVVEINKIREIINSLIQEATRFLNTKIKDIYVVIDTKQIKLKDFKSTDVSVPNGIFDYNVWNNEMSNLLSCDNTGEDYIFSVKFKEWIIDGRTYYSIDNLPQHKVNKIDVIGTTYLINKILYEQYLNLFEKIDIPIKLTLPFNMCYSLLVNSNKNSNVEIFVNLNNNGLVITTLQGNNIISHIQFEKFSLNSFFEAIKERTGMKIEQIKRYFDILPDIQNTAIDLKIANSYSTSYLNLKTITNKDFNKFIQEYAESIAKFIMHEFIPNATKHLNFDIKRVNLFPTNTMVEIVFKNVIPYINIDSKLVEFSYAMNLNPIFNKSNLMALYILNNQNKDIFLSVPGRKNKTELIRKE